MTSPTQQHHGFDLAGRDRAACPRQNVAYRHDLGGTGPLRRQANRECFVEKPDLDDLNNFVEIDRPNHNALARLNVDKTFRIQAIEGLVNGRSPDLEKTGDRAFAQFLPRLECTGDDAMLDRLIGLVLQGLLQNRLRRTVLAQPRDLVHRPSSTRDRQRQDIVAMADLPANDIIDELEIEARGWPDSA